MKKYQKKTIISRIVYLCLSAFLVLIGVGLVYASTSDYLESKRLANRTIDKERIGVEPLNLSIPNLDRELPISDGFIVDNRWKVAESGVSYLITSGSLGEAGNVVLYGHNTTEALGGLWRVRNGDIVEVSGSDNNIYKYEIIERKEVKPNQVEILEQTGDSRLTIYTCSGFLDTARFVIVGKLI